MRKRIDLRGRYYSIQELTKLRNDLAKEVNRNLRELEKAKKTKYAYRTAIANIRQIRGGRYRRYEERKKGYTKDDLPRLKLEIDELETYLSYKTGSLEGYMDYEENVLERFRERGLKVSNPQSFFDFLSSETYRNLANRKIDSGVLQEFYDRALSKKMSITELNQLLDEYEKGEKSVKELYKEAGMRFLKRKRK